MMLIEQTMSIDSSTSFSHNFKLPNEHSNKDGDNSIYKSVRYWIDYIEKIYVLENSEEIKRFLVSNGDLIEILQAAPEHIYEIFGYVPICLELHHDPEEGWDELFIVIKSSLSPKEAIKRNIELFEKWFIHVMDSVQVKLNITEEPL